MAVQEGGSGRGRLVLAGVVAVILVAGFLMWRRLSPTESTDDAQVNGHVSPVASRVAGPVVNVHVGENELVNTGDVLVEIDPSDYRVAVARAEADLAAAEATLNEARTNVPMMSTQATNQLKAARANAATATAAARAAAREADAARAKLASAKAKLAEAAANQTRTAQDLDRMKPLIAKDEISKQQFDASVNAADAARALAQSAQAAADEAQSNVEVADAKHAQAESAVAQADAEAAAAATAPEQVHVTEARASAEAARVQQAQTSLDRARLDLDRTTVRAAISGIVSRKNVEVGQVVQPGQLLLALVSLDDVWITANFKETQLTTMRSGQDVDVTVDAAGNRRYRGHIDSFAGATGATFSLLPPENATGNFVKVVQRVPVRIVLEAGENSDRALRPGMSAVTTVRIK